VGLRFKTFTTRPQNPQNTLYNKNANNHTKQKGGIRTPKNVTVYLPDETAGKMEKYPEVNWSEICRKAVNDYVDTRSHMDIGPILEKLRAEHNEAYKQGQIFFYQIAPKMSLKDFDSWYPSISTMILEGREPGLFGDTPPLSPEVAQHQAIRHMDLAMHRFCRDNNISYPEKTADAFYEGAIAAFMNVYSEIKPKKN
jgi:hypothetical protein